MHTFFPTAKTLFSHVEEMYIFSQPIIGNLEVEGNVFPEPHKNLNFYGG